MEEQEEQKDRLEFVRNQLNLLTDEIKKKIKEVTEEVAEKVSCRLFKLMSWNILIMAVLSVHKALLEKPPSKTIMCNMNC